MAWFVNSKQRDTIVTLATQTRGAKEPEPVQFANFQGANLVAQALVQTTEQDWYPSTAIAGEPIDREAAFYILDGLGTYADAVKQLEEAAVDFNKAYEGAATAITEIADDANVKEALSTLEGAGDDLAAAGKHLARAWHDVTGE